MATLFLFSDYPNALRLEGGWTDLGADGSDPAKFSGWAACAVHFKGTPTDGTIGARTFGAGQVISLWRFSSGVWETEAVARVIAPNDLAWHSVQLASGLDTGTEYRWLVAFGSKEQFATGIEIGSLNTAVLPIRDTFAGFGDSIIEAVQGTRYSGDNRFGDATQGDVWRLAISKDKSCYNRGISGTPVCDVSGRRGGAPSATAGENRTADITSIVPAPSEVLVRYSLNDPGNVTGASPPETVEEFGDAYDVMIGRLTSGLPSSIFYCESTPKTASSAYPPYGPWDAKIEATAGATPNCYYKYIFEIPGYTGEVEDGQTSDEVHPTGLGYDYFFDWEVENLTPPAPSGNALMYDSTAPSPGDESGDLFRKLNQAVYEFYLNPEPPADPPVNTDLPVITLDANNPPLIGDTLSCSTGTWSNSPTSYAYQWRRGGANIGGATSSTYDVQAEDVDQDLDCFVIATNDGGDSDPAYASAVTVRATIDVSGAGLATVNGIYTRRGEFDGKQYYNLVGQPDNTEILSIYYSSGDDRWFIRTDDTTQVYRTSFTGTSVPWGTWESLDPGNDPAPTVSLITP